MAISQITLSGKQMVDLTVETKAKTAMRKVLTSTLLNMSVQCFPYKKVRQDEVLFSKVYLKESTIRALPAAELVTTENNFFTVVTELLPNLTGYDITSELVTEGRKLASDYAEKYLKPKDEKVQVSSYTKQPDVIYPVAKKALKKIDFIALAFSQGTCIAVGIPVETSSVETGPRQMCFRMLANRINNRRGPFRL